MNLFGKVKEIERGVIRSYPTNKNEPSPIDERRLPVNQVDYVSQVIAYFSDNIGALIAVERAIYTTTWMLIARASAPIVTRNLNYKPDVTQSALNNLIERKLLWYDTDLRAVLQCPPFSALHMPHQVKTFGWERAYTCSFIDAPLALLIYGPNTWMDVTSVCPRSGEELCFRVMLSDSWTLRIEAPSEAKNWRVWIPSQIESLTSLGVRGERAHMNAFHTSADLDTYRHYNSDENGTVYTLDQAIYFSECLLRAYQKALAAR
jgi:hypothetical protein